MLKRISWTVVDQGLTSATTFVISIVAATSTTEIQFGLFSACLATYLLCQVVFRAAFIEPLVVQYGGATTDTLHDALRTGRGCAVVCAVTVGLLVALVGFAVGSIGSMTLLAASITALLLSDLARFSFIAEGRSHYAALTAFICLSVSGAALLVLKDLAATTPTVILACWSASALVAAAVTTWYSRTEVTFRALPAWLRTHRPTMAAHLADALLSSGSRQLAALIIAAVGGLSTAAAMRGAQLAMGPFTVLDLILGTLVLSEGSRIRRIAPQRFATFTLATSATVALGALLFGTAVSYVPRSIGLMILGGTWDKAVQIVIPMALLVSANALLLGASAGLRVIGRSATSARFRAVSAPIVLGAAFVGVTTHGALGAVIAQAAVTGVAAAVWWRYLLRHAAPCRSATPSEVDLQQAERGCI
jgi:O-antigen/teichoic acid export membrane protein